MQSVWGRFVEKCVEFVTDSAFVHVEVVLRLVCGPAAPDFYSHVVT